MGVEERVGDLGSQEGKVVREERETLNTWPYTATATMILLHNMMIRVCYRDTRRQNDSAIGYDEQGLF